MAALGSWTETGRRAFWLLCRVRVVVALVYLAKAAAAHWSQIADRDASPGEILAVGGFAVLYGAAIYLLAENR